MGKTGRRVYEKDWREEKEKGKWYILIKTYLNKKIEHRTKPRNSRESFNSTKSLLVN